MSLYVKGLHQINDRMTNKKGKINFHGEEACEAVSK